MARADCLKAGFRRVLKAIPLSQIGARTLTSQNSLLDPPGDARARPERGFLKPSVGASRGQAPAKFAAEAKIVNRGRQVGPSRRLIRYYPLFRWQHLGTDKGKLGCRGEVSRAVTARRSSIAIILKRRKPSRRPLTATPRAKDAWVKAHSPVFFPTHRKAAVAGLTGRVQPPGTTRLRAIRVNAVGPGPDLTGPRFPSARRIAAAPGRETI